MRLNPTQSSGIPPQAQQSPAQVTDGTSNTIMIGEAAKTETSKTGLRPQSEPNTTSRVADAGADMKSRLAENKMQADLRAAELKTQLEATDTAKSFMDYTDDSCM